MRYHEITNEASGNRAKIESNESMVRAKDNDTVYKNWRKEVGTDAETTRRIINPNNPKLPKAVGQNRVEGGVMDIVKRLRYAGDHASFDPHLYHKAANEIESLREALYKISALSDFYARKIARDALQQKGSE
jgi:hypothetical protein